MDLFEKSLAYRLFSTIFDEDCVDYASILFSDNYSSLGKIVSKEDGIVSGIQLAVEMAKFAGLDAQEIEKNGNTIKSKAILLEITGKANLLLQAERPICNLLMHLSGISTETAKYVEAVKDLQVRICPTRKTTPGLRYWEKQAVVHGGGYFHRFGLSDGVMIKDNHIAAYNGDISKLIRVTRENIPHTIKIEVEIDRIEQIEPSIISGADILLLDNFDKEYISKVVKLCRELDQKYQNDRYKIGSGRLLLEASGGIDITSVRNYAEAGVDIISIGSLSHSVKALNISMDLERI